MAFNKLQQYNAYNMATQTVSKTRQVVMLYDGAIRFAKQAKTAIEENRIEDRYNLLHKVSEILMGLQGSLDFDNGGEIAPLLFDYYSSLDARILYIQHKNDVAILDSIISELKQMRDAWGKVDSHNITTEEPQQVTEVYSEPEAVKTPPKETPPVQQSMNDGSVYVSA